MRVRLCVAVLCCVVTQSIEAQWPSKPGGGMRFLVTVFGSLDNEYKRGNVDDMAQYYSGDPSKQATAGAPSFTGIEGVLYQPVAEANGGIGFGVQMVKSAPHAIWWSDLGFGYRNEAYFDATFLNLIMPLRFRMSGGSTLVFEPGLDLPVMTGRFNANTASTGYHAIGSGWHFALGADMRMLGPVGATFRAGQRMAKAYATLEANAGQVALCCGAGSEKIQVDWSGKYMTLGLIVAF